MVRENCQHTEIGIIPNDWTVKKIKDFTDATSGGTPSTFIPEYWNGSIRWMNSGELNLRKVYEVRGRITELGLKKSSTKKIPKNCILIGLAGQGKTRGTVAINYVELCINQSICAIFPNKYFIPEYIYYNLDSRYDELRNLSTGEGGRGGLNLTIIRNIVIPFPPTIEEQSNITKILSDTDELIKQLEYLITKKKNIKQGAMQELLTGKRRLGGFDQKWKLITLGKVFNLFTGTAKSRYITKSGKYLIIDMGSISSEGKNISKKQTDFEGDFLQLGDLVMPKDDIGGGNIIGKTVFIDENKKYVLGDHVYALRIKDNSNNSKFLSYMINSFAINSEIRKKVTGSAQLGINRKTVEEQMIMIPTQPEEQLAISEILSDMDVEIKELEKKRDKYMMIKNGMMQKLLTGEIRVK